MVVNLWLSDVGGSDVLDELYITLPVWPPAALRFSSRIRACCRSAELSGCDKRNDY